MKKWARKKAKQLKLKNNKTKMKKGKQNISAYTSPLPNYIQTF